MREKARGRRMASARHLARRREHDAHLRTSGGESERALRHRKPSCSAAQRLTRQYMKALSAGRCHRTTRGGGRARQNAYMYQAIQCEAKRGGRARRRRRGAGREARSAASSRKLSRRPGAPVAASRLARRAVAK